MKAVIIDKLKGLDDCLFTEPVLIPKPKEVHKLSNHAYSLTPESTISHVNIEESNDLEGLLDADNEEAYNLEVKDERVRIYSNHEKGLYYGMQTLIQLMKNTRLIPEIRIRDAPDFKVRGVAQDISRGQVFTIENAKRYIKVLSHYKMNTYCLYLEDMFAHPKHPLIGSNRGALTVEEVKELDEYARKHYIELIPIFECFGHADNILTHKEYAHLGEFPGAQCFDASNPEYYSFINDYISLLSETFSTDCFHIGCDESFDFGRLRTRGLVKEKGRSTALTEVYERIYEITKRNGNKHIIMYDDVLRLDKGIQRKLNKDIILMYWNYASKKRHPSLKKYLNAGFKVIVSPSMLNLQRNFPDNKNSSSNIINFVKTAYDYRDRGCLGVLTSTWQGQRFHSLRENEVFGAVLTAGVSWSTKGFDYETFKQDYGHLFYGIKKEKLKSFNELFTLLSSSASKYYLKFLNIPLTTIHPPFGTYMFKHPLIRKNDFEELGDLGVKCLRLYDELKPGVLFERENFECMEFGAELAKYLGNNKKEDASYIRDRYEELWLRAAKRPGLDEILKRFDTLIRQYDEEAVKDPYLPSEWIWAREKTCPVKPRYFRKVIEIDGPVKKAVIQGVACNQMNVYVNNHYVGDVFSRFSLSVLPVKNRVKAWDVTRYLNEGKNVIAIKAFNYEGFKGAVNLYGQIQLSGDSLIKEIKTDRTWVTQKKMIYNSDDWRQLSFNDDDWRTARSYGRPPEYNGDIYTPDLLSGEVSDTQDYFGVQGHFYHLLRNTAGSFLTRLIKPFIPKIIKSLKPRIN